ncbi:MAG: nucleotide exchange factor GrpE [Pseudomonadota bacterium]
MSNEENNKAQNNTDPSGQQPEEKVYHINPEAFEPKSDMFAKKEEPPQDPETPEVAEAPQPQEGTAENLSSDDQIAQLQQELLDNRDRTMRALAEAENTRRRAIKDREDAGKFAIAKFARSLLDFSDNFERALDAIPNDIKSADPRVVNVVEGIEAMQRELLDVFDKNGIKKIEPLDEKFDANFHEVMFEAPVPGKEVGIIIQVVEPGYVLNDRLLRAAKVGIAKAGSDEPSPTDPGTNIDESA